MEHDLKTWPEYYEAVKRGRKGFEARFKDRPFKVGDVLILKEWCPVAKKFTGRRTAKKITYIMEGGSFGIQPGWCVMSII